MSKNDVDRSAQNERAKLMIARLNQLAQEDRLLEITNSYTWRALLDTLWSVLEQLRRGKKE